MRGGEDGRRGRRDGWHWGGPVLSGGRVGLRGRRGGGAGGRSGGLVDPRFDYERKRKIESAADATFRKLTGEQLRGKEAWMRWWNKKGKKKSKW